MKSANVAASIAALTLVLGGCSDCGNRAAEVRELVEPTAPFLDSIELVPNGGFLIDPRPEVQKAIRLRFLLPVRRDSIHLTNFTIISPPRAIDVEALVFDDGNSNTTLSVTLVLTPNLMHADISVPLSAQLSWDASGIEFQPGVGGTAPPKPTSPINFDFAIAASGPDASPPTVDFFGLPNEPSPPQPGWGRPVTMNDLLPLGTETLDTVGRDNFLGAAIADQVLPHARIEGRFSEPVTTTLVSFDPLDTEGLQFQTESLLLVLDPAEKIFSQTPRGLLPDWTYSVTIGSRDSAALLPIAGGVQDTSGHFMMPRYGPDVAAAAIADGMTLADLYGDVDYRFRTSPLRIEQPRIDGHIGLADAPSLMPRVRIDYARPLPADLPGTPTSLQAVLFDDNGVLLASAQVPFEPGNSDQFWRDATIDQSGLFRDVYRRALQLSAAPDDIDEDVTLRATMLGSGGEYLGADELRFHFDVVPPTLDANDVSFDNATAEDRAIDDLCVATDLDVVTIVVSFDGGQTVELAADSDHCTAVGARKQCCYDSVSIGLPPGVKEGEVSFTVTVIDDGGNESESAERVSRPDCEQPPLKLVRTGVTAGFALGRSPVTDGIDVLFATTTQIRHATWNGVAWEFRTAYALPPGQRFGQSLDLAYDAFGRPIACFLQAPITPGVSEQAVVGDLMLITASALGPREWSVTTLTNTARPMHCAITGMRGATTEPAVAFAGRFNFGSPSEADNTSPMLFLGSDAGGSLIPIPGPSGSAALGMIGHDIDLAWDDLSERLHVAWRSRFGAGASGGQIVHSVRSANGAFVTREVLHPLGTNGRAFGANPAIGVGDDGRAIIAYQPINTVGTDRGLFILQRQTSDPSDTAGWSLLFFDSRIGSWPPNRGGRATAGFVSVGKPLTMVMAAGAAHVAYNRGGSSRPGSQIVIVRAGGGTTSVDVVDSAVVGTMEIGLTVTDDGVRSVLWDDARDPNSSGRRSVHFYDDTTGSLRHRDAAEPPLEPACGTYFRTVALSENELGLVYPVAAGERMLPGAEEGGILSPALGIPPEFTLRPIEGVVLSDTVGGFDSALQDVFVGVSLEIGRGPLRYQTAVCVPDTVDSSLLEVSACRRDRVVFPLPDFSFSTGVERLPVQGEPPAVVLRVKETSIVGTTEPAEGACSEPGQYLYFDGVDYHCKTCPHPSHPDSGLRSLVPHYVPVLDRCIACAEGSAHPDLPRIIDDTTSVGCIGCTASAEQPTVEETRRGVKRYVVDSHLGQCIRCSPGTAPRPCVTDDDCSDLGGAMLCGRIDRLSGDTICVQRKSCSSADDCSEGEQCDASRAGDGRACRRGDDAVAGSPPGLPPPPDPQNATRELFECEPIGCNECWRNDYCTSDADCPINHHCMNQADGGFSSTPEPNAEMAFATPMCLLRPILHGLTSDSPAGDLFETFGDSLTNLRVPLAFGGVTDLGVEDLKLTDLQARIVDMTASIEGGSTDSTGALILRIALQSPVVLQGSVSTPLGRTSFRVDITGDSSPDEVVLSLFLQPYIWGGRLQFDLFDGALDGDISLTGDIDCGNFIFQLFCSTVTSTIFMVIRIVDLILPITDTFVPVGTFKRQLVGDQFAGLSKDYTRFVRNLLGDTLLREILLREPGSTHVRRESPLRPGEVADQVRLHGDAFQLTLRDCQ